MKFYFKILVLGMFLICFNCHLGLGQTKLQFKLDKTYVTSAGAYQTDGTLVRTLWRKITYEAGSHQATWDGLDDNGQPVAPGNYQIKIVAHNVNYIWEGVIGNTSTSFTRDVWRSLVSMQDMAFSGTNGFAAVNYNEGQAGIFQFATQNPQAPRAAIGVDGNTSFTAIAADDKYFYAASNNSGWDTNNSIFVSRSLAGTNEVTAFPAGRTIQAAGALRPIPYAGVIDIFQKAGGHDNNVMNQQKITGIAVQQTGNLLAVAHQGLNEVHLFDKSTGANVGTLTLPSPGRVSFSVENELWAVSGSEVRKYHNTGIDPQKPTFQLQTTIVGLSHPLAIAASPMKADLVLVADGGNSQQVKAYSRNGAALWVYGQAGGYAANGPDVTNNKFHFVGLDPLDGISSDRDPMGTEGAFLRFAPDGSFWLSDRGNVRILHFSADHQYLEHISYLPDRLRMTADPVNPTRVFSEWLEFKVDYSRPLQPGDPSVASSGGSWKLTKNWVAGVDWKRYNSFSNVVTLSNGRTYGQVYDETYRNTSSKLHIVELPATGQLRFTGILVDDQDMTGRANNLYANGDLRYWEQRDISPGLLEQKAYRRVLKGFNSQGDPQWADREELATLPVRSKNGWYTYIDPSSSRGWGSTPRLPITDSNILISFNAYRSTVTNSMHLGGVKIGQTQWLWKASPSQPITKPDGLGTFTEQDGYGGHNGIAAFAEGRNVLYGYDGQYASFSNQFVHFFDNGLFIGQFGQTNDDSEQFHDPRTAVPAYANNIATMYMVKAAGKMYVYCADEGVHAGIHRWRVDGADDIKELIGSGKLGGSIQVGGAVTKPTGFYYQGGMAPTVSKQVATTNLANWNSDPAGTGEPPVSFVDPGQTFYITAPTAADSPLMLSSTFIQGAGSKLVIGDGATSKPVHVVMMANGNKNETGTTVDLGSNGELVIQGTTGALPVLGQLAAGSLLTYDAHRADIQLTTTTGALGSLRLKGGSAAALARNLVFQGNLTLSENSMLELGAYDATVASGHTVSGDVNAYIHTAAGGALRQTVPGNSTSNPIFYPVGQSSYNPAWLSQNAIGTTDIFAVSVGDSTFMQYTAVSVGKDKNRGVGRDMRGVGKPVLDPVLGAGRTWYIGETVTGGSHLVLTLQGPLANGATPAKVSVSHYHVPTNAPIGSAPSWDANPAEQVKVQVVNVPGQTNVYASTRTNITDFSPFTLSVPAPLPVELISFGAKRNKAAILCDWATASEKNSAYFFVERSQDGQQYIAIGKVAGAGNSPNKLNYRYVDVQPLAGEAYYRLRQVDHDGAEVFSPVAVVASADKSVLLANVVPNPGTGVFELITSGTPLLEANVYNSLGKHIWRLVPTPEQAQRLRFDLTTFSAGIYTLHLKTATGLTTVKLVKN